MRGNMSVLPPDTHITGRWWGSESSGGGRRPGAVFSHSAIDEVVRNYLSPIPFRDNPYEENPTRKSTIHRYSLLFLRLAIDTLLLECQRERKDRRKSTKFCTDSTADACRVRWSARVHRSAVITHFCQWAAQVTVAAGSIHQHSPNRHRSYRSAPTVYRADVLKFHLRRDHVTEDGRERADNGEKMKSAKTDVTSLAMQLSLHHSTCSSSSSSRKKLAVAAADD